MAKSKDKQNKRDDFGDKNKPTETANKAEANQRQNNAQNNATKQQFK